MTRFSFAALAVLSLTNAASAAEFGVVTKLDQGAQGLGQIGLIRQAGVSINRDQVTWRNVEATRGVLGWPANTAALYATLKQSGIRTSVVLSTSNPNYDGGRFATTPAAIAAYARFAAHVARQLRGQTVAFEIGNEWRPTQGVNGTTTMVDYVNLFVAAANAIHAVDPAAKVVADPAIFGYLPSGAIPAATTTVGAAARRGLRVADGVVVHQYPYQYGGMKTLADAQAYLTTAMTRRAAWLETLAGKPVPLYVTEYGWPLLAGRNLTQAEQATQIAETTRRLAAMPFVRVAIVYELIDSCMNKANIECTFGLYERGPQSTIVPKPALVRFKQAVEAAAH
jgi:trimeric autotransporter adhesin